MFFLDASGAATVARRRGTTGGCDGARSWRALHDRPYVARERMAGRLVKVLPNPLLLDPSAAYVLTPAANGPSDKARALSERTAESLQPLPRQSST